MHFLIFWGRGVDIINIHHNILCPLCPDSRDGPILASEQIRAPPGVQTGLQSAGSGRSVRGARTGPLCHPASLLLRRERRPRSVSVIWDFLIDILDICQMSVLIGVSDFRYLWYIYFVYQISVSMWLSDKKYL